MSGYLQLYKVSVVQDVIIPENPYMVMKLIQSIKLFGRKLHIQCLREQHGPRWGYKFSFNLRYQFSMTSSLEVSKFCMKSAEV